MAEVLERTLASKASDESFHSSHSQQPPSPTFTPASNQLNSDLHTAALQAAGLPVYDIEAFLNDPRHEPSPPVKSPPLKKQKTQTSSSASSEPVQLGSPRTSHHVAGLHHLCQERGVVAEYEIDGDQAKGFNGTVTVGNESISAERRWPNKKEAKESLAALMVPLVREMEKVKREKQKVVTGGGEQEKEKDKNWVGMLL
ncbi:MAG: hypothetical protein Q9183_001315, partial [Haloplaca sp. 2 TL-2023]